MNNLKSYNCFHSALGNILEQYCFNKTHLLINNRWQFFYRSACEYSYDKRMLGEWPLLYDEKHLGHLREEIGINISFEKVADSSMKYFLERVKAKPTILFVNKFLLMDKPSVVSGKRCVSTIIVKSVNENIFHCDTFDRDFNLSLAVSADKIYHTWLNASELEQLNRCNVEVRVSKKRSKPDIEAFAKDLIKSSLKEYLAENHDGDIYYGLAGIKKFSNDILNWDKNDFEKFIDCAMYIDILIQQRILFTSALKELSLRKNTILDDANLLMENWNNLKILLFIVGMRKQSGAIDQLSVIIQKISDLEFNLVIKMLESI
ncbi:MAG: hypothetical protein FWG91_01275 [Lachnospiraceae bacterium]|nr:hypothetical protein [Lachnospiraceae bacterium]